MNSESSSTAPNPTKKEPPPNSHNDSTVMARRTNDTNSSRGIRDDEYDYASDSEIEVLKPLPKLPKEAPKLPDSVLRSLSSDFEGSTSLSDTLDTVFMSHTEGQTSRVGKRASNVLKLTQEADQLKAQLRAMTERLEAAERRRLALDERLTSTGGKQSTSMPISSRDAAFGRLNGTGDGQRPVTYERDRETSRI